jgi:glutathione S-transferase
MLDLSTWHTANGKKPVILLAELEIPYELHLVNFALGEQKRPEYLELLREKYPEARDGANEVHHWMKRLAARPAVHRGMHLEHVKRAA